MSDQIFLITILLILGTILVVFGMKYLSAAHQARSRQSSEDAYRNLAETAVASQADTASLLTTMQAAVADIATRLTAIEKILKEV